MNITIIISISLLTFVGLIVIHEFGHMLAGYILGIPKNKMSIQFINRKKEKNIISSKTFSINPHIALLDNNNQKISPSPDQIEKYIEILENYIPCEKRMFWFVAGGHVFEFIIILTVALISYLTNENFLMQFAFQITLVTILLAINYLLIELFSALKSKELTGGDFTGLWAISPSKTIMLYLIYFTGLIGAFLLLIPN